jgi:hypothetical protein
VVERQAQFGQTDHARFLAKRRGARYGGGKGDGFA